MKKEELDSILIACKYLTICKSHGNDDKTSVARYYLTSKIKKALNKNKSVPFWKFIFGDH